MKTAIIIGGSGGIGFETARELEKKGMNVIISYYLDSEKAGLEEGINGCGIKNYSLIQMNVKEEESVSKGMSSLLNKSNIDVVIYSVSSQLIYKKITQLSWSEFTEHIEVQIKGFYNIVSALTPLIEKKHKIKFIAVLSDSCLGKPPSMLSHYVTAEYGLMGLVKSLSSELSKNNCTFNMVSPGMVDTKLLSNLPPKLMELTAASNPLRRIANPSEISKVISFLASEDADYLNGANIPINGGNIIP